MNKFTRFISVMLLSLMAILAGCATGGHDQWIRDEQDKYYETCRAWQKTEGNKITTRKEGEESLSVQAVMQKRCEESPTLCQPPRKPKSLLGLESSWGAQPIPDSCGLVPKW